MRYLVWWLSLELLLVLGGDRQRAVQARRQQEPGQQRYLRALLHGSAATAVGTAPARQIRYMSFYGDAPLAQRGIVNARMWDVWNGDGDSPYADIDKHYNDSGGTMGAFLEIAALVWHRQGCNLSASTLNVSTCGVKPDWQEALTNAMRAARPQLAVGSIVGLFLGDEVQCGGIPAANVSSVATACRALLDANGGRKAKIWINECVDPFLPAQNTSTLPDKLRRYPNSSLNPRQPCGGIPAALDLVSVDNYFSWSSDQNSVPPSERHHPTWTEEAWVVRDFYRDYVIQRLLPHQRLMVVPGLFGNDSTTPAGLQRTIGEQMADRLDAYWDWLSGTWEDDVTNTSAWVVGLAPFHWFQRGHSTGASNYSEVIAKLRVIGKVVQENSRSSPSAVDWATAATAAVLRDHANFTIGEAMQDWQVANAIDSVAVYTAQASPGAARDYLIEVLQRAFKVVNSTAPNPNQCCPGSWGAGNDDVQWGLFAWVHAYEAMGSRPQDFVLIEAAGQYLDWVITNEAVWRTETNGTANQCGLGYHNEPKYDCSGNVGPQDFKNSVTNTQFLTSAMLLHPFAQRLGKPQGYYLHKALSEWQWLERTGLRNSTTGLYVGGLDMQSCRPSTDVNGGAWVATYNQGILLPGLAKLARATKNQSLLMQACDTVAAVVENMTTPDGVLHETPTCDVFWGGPCDRWAIFKGAYMRGIWGLFKELRSPELSRAHLSVPSGCMASIKHVVTASAHSAWYHGRCPSSNSTNDPERAQWSFDWTGSRPNFLQTCNGSRPGVNLPSANVAAADVFNTLVALAQ